MSLGPSTFDSPETLSASKKDLGLITSTGKHVVRDSSQNDEVSSSQVWQAGVHQILMCGRTCKMRTGFFFISDTNEEVQNAIQRVRVRNLNTRE